VTDRFRSDSPEDFLQLKQRAAEMPAAIALTSPRGDALTYLELDRRLHAMRLQAAGAGLGPGEIAALVLPNGPDLITAFLAVAGIGAGAPLDPSSTESEFRYYLDRLGARIVIVPDGVSSPAVAAADALHIPVLRIRSSGAFLRTAPDHLETALSFRKTDAALLLFTSATTGAPKLVPLTWANLRAMASREINALELSATDRFLSLMPLFHLHGLAAVLAQLFRGGAVISTPGFNPATFLDWLDRLQPTWFSSSPPLNRAILALARRHPEVFRRGSLRLIRTTGAAPQPEVLTALEESVGVPVLTGYGLTETGGVTRDTAQARKPGSVGRSSGLEVAIVDPLGNLMADGHEGEIVVRGASVTSGYVDDPEANQSAFRNGWFHTGDIGRLDSEKFLFITGRLKEMIDRGGEKIVPQGVEDVLASHPAVAEAAVFAVAHPTLGEDLAAAVVLRAGAAATALELRRFAATRLAPFKVPRRIEFLDIIPRTSTGKPQRSLLAERLRNRVRSSSLLLNRTDRGKI
jgi:acyl-CoA synthetase (AMP-forming)/AMP-acid ligase II